MRSSKWKPKCSLHNHFIFSFSGAVAVAVAAAVENDFAATVVVVIFFPSFMPFEHIIYENSK